MIGEFAALGAAISWAIAPILYRKALANMNPVSANIVRCASNAAVMLLILFAVGGTGALANLSPEIMLTVAASGIIGLGIGDTLYLVSLKSVGVARAVPLAATYPLFSLLWTTSLGKPVTSNAVLGALVILFGIWLLSHEKIQSAPEKQTETKNSFRGIIAALATAVVWSISITLMDIAISVPAASSLDVNYAIITLRIATMAAILLAFAPVIDKNRGFLKTKRKALAQLCIGGLAANGVGWLLMNVSFQNILEAQAIPISSTTPLFSTIAGLALFHEKITKRNALGAIVIVVGIALIFIT